MSARRFTSIKGNAKVTLEGPYKEMFQDMLRQAYPDIVRTLEATVTKIKNDAQEEWPVRRKNSKGSVDAFEIRFGLTNDGITVSLENDAPYAAGILAGKVKPSLNRDGQQTTVPPSRLVWWELLWKPSKRATNKVVQALADELMDEVKKVK